MSRRGAARPPKRPAADLGDGGVFAALGAALLAALAVAGVALLVGHWSGEDAQQAVLVLGELAVLAGLVVRLVLGGGRR